MAFTSLLSLVALAAIARAAPAAETAVCSDGTRVSNSACCAFIPVRLPPLWMIDFSNLSDILCRQLAQDLQTNVFQNQCGEDAHEVIRLIFRSSFHARSC